MAFCSNCGQAVADGTKFCPKCGISQTGGIPGATMEAGQTPSPVSATGPTPMPVPTGEEPTSGKAIGSLIAGILFFFWPAAIVAIVLGHLALAEIKASAGRVKGHGMALAGLILGYCGAAFIPIILIIAAIAIPNLLRSRMAANEAVAVHSLRELNVAAIQYETAYDNGYPPTLAELDGAASGTASCDAAHLIDPVLASGQKGGYAFAYQAGESNGSPKEGCRVAGAKTFSIQANPLQPGTTGRRSFYTDESGVIRFSREGPADKDSPSVESSGP